MNDFYMLCLLRVRLALSKSHSVHYEKPGTVDLKCSLRSPRETPAGGGINLALAVGLALWNTSPAAPLLGARTADQLRDNLMAAEITLSDEQSLRLDEESAPATPDYPYRLLAESTAERRKLTW